MKFLIFLLLLVLSVNTTKLNSSKISSESRIIGGQIANAGSYNFIAAIHVNTNNSRFFCGGALIGNQWILTAGTCVNNAVLFTIQLGSHKLTEDDSNRKIYSTSNYFLHPNFDALTLENDIGIIHLRMPVTLTAYIQTVYLYPNPLKDHVTTISLRFGQTSDDDPELSENLRFVTVVTLSNEECRTFYGHQITDTMVCVGGNFNQGTCIGDTGSPLIIRPGNYHAMVGVASFISANSCESTNPSSFTRIYPYKDWIHNITGRYP